MRLQVAGALALLEPPLRIGRRGDPGDDALWYPACTWLLLLHLGLRRTDLRRCGRNRRGHECGGRGRLEGVGDILRERSKGGEEAGCKEVEVRLRRGEISEDVSLFIRVLADQRA